MPPITLTPTDDPSGSRLDAIATHWNLIRDAHAAGRPGEAETARRALVLRYARAIRTYVGGLVQCQADADELSQEVIVRLMKGDFAVADQNRGRFRDLLKTAVRNMVRNYWARTNRRRPADIDLDALPGASDADAAPAWDAAWQANVLEHAWESLREYERTHPGSHVYTLLRLRADHPQDTSEGLAQKLGVKLGAAVRADACRQILRRSRLRFAQYLIDEIKIGLADTAPDRITEELLEIGLLEYVKDYLPADWKYGGKVVSD